jgi:hypothetical protein
VAPLPGSVEFSWRIFVRKNTIRAIFVSSTISTDFSRAASASISVRTQKVWRKSKPPKEILEILGENEPKFGKAWRKSL